jgi:glycosyltransferase involved in cell wall biosynthesis
MSALSVITVNYNDVEGLKKTIHSVLAQTFHDIEYIVIDGGSSDGSKTVLSQHSNRIAFWVSEPDTGVYNAMNKGITNSTGSYLLFLNSGDYFYSSDAIEVLFDKSEGQDIVYGDLMVRDPTKIWKKTYPSTLTFSYFRHDALPHPCSLIKRGLFTSLGLYREDLRIVSDWAFFMNAVCLHSASYKHVDHPISVFGRDGLSSLPRHQATLAKEKEAVLQEYYRAFLPDYKAFENNAFENNAFENKAFENSAFENREPERMSRERPSIRRTTRKLLVKILGLG